MSGGHPPDQLTDPALQTLWRLASGAAAQVTSLELRSELRDIREGLGQPLRLAILGAVSAGKSTLVNALLKMPIAAKAERETTRFPTWLQYGTDHGAVFVDSIEGTHRTELLPGNRLPEDLGVLGEDIDRVRIHLDVPLLQRLTIIDTPGSNTTTGHLQERADRALREDAQAIFFLTEVVSTQDRDTLSEFRALCARGRFSATNALLVLTKVDNNEPPDPWPGAWRRAQNRLDQLGGLVFDAVPVAATLAETGGARLLTLEQLEILRGLAVLEPDDREDAVLDPGSVDVPWDLELQNELSGQLRRYGFHVALEFVTANPAAGLDEAARSPSPQFGVSIPSRVPRSRRRPGGRGGSPVSPTPSTCSRGVLTS